MARASAEEQTLDLRSVTHGTNTGTLEQKRSLTSGFKILALFKKSAIFKLGLLFNDIIFTILGFSLGLWITGWNVVVLDDFNKAAAFFMLGLPVIAFFQLNHLYDFHLLFLMFQAGG